MVEAFKDLYKNNIAFRYAVTFFVIGLIALLLSFSKPGQQQNKQQPSIRNNQTNQNQQNIGFPFFNF